jgi:hypothetical protein
LYLYNQSLFREEDFKMKIRCLTILAVVVLLLGSSFDAQANPIGFSVRSNADDHLYAIDLMTGFATDLGRIAFGDAEGLGFVGNELYTIGGTVDEFWNITTPPGVKVGDTGSRAGIDAGLDYDPASGTMYNINGESGGSSLYSIDLGNGSANLIGSTSTFIDGMGINSSGVAYGVDGIFSDSLYTVNLSDGSTSLVGALGLGNISTQFGLSFYGDVLYGLSSGGQIYTFNTTTGQATFVANVLSLQEVPLSGFEGLAIQRAPEPGTLLLLIPGLAALWRRRRS